MPEQENSPKVVAYSSKGNGKSGILLGVALSIIILIVLNYFSLVNLSSLFPFLPQRNVSSQPIPTSKPNEQVTFAQQLALCSISKNGNPLVDDAQFDDTYNMAFGTLRGNINKVVQKPEEKAAEIEIVSTNGVQSYTFTVSEEEGLVYDRVALKDASLSDLEAGITVVVSYNCFKERSENERLKIAQIAIIGRLN